MPESTTDTIIFHGDQRISLVNPDTILENGVRKLLISDHNSENTLQNILKELKKINIQLSILTDITITGGDIDE